MSKKKSIIYFILSVVLIAGLCYVCLLGIDGGRGSASNIIQGLDLQGGVSITFEVVDKDYTNEEFEDTFRKMEKRAYARNDEATIYTEGDNRITVEIPGSDDVEAVLADLARPGVLQFVTDYNNKDKEKVWLSGADIKDAQPVVTQDENTGAVQYLVALTFNEDAAKTFEDVTGKYLGQKIYIVYDGEIISEPYVSTKISGGEATITGMASVEEAEKLSSDIRLGALKLELKEISSKVVGAKLGDDAISTSLIAGMIGIAFIFVFMLVIYRVPGLAAGLALIAYIALDLIAINAFDITLTLPGIAGVILSIGMAVDANVIIFARIKEELVDGVEVREAIKIGFNKATSAIVDGNITTLIAAVILMYMGTGPIQGFAKTLAYGIVISMISAMAITRTLLYLLCNMGFDKASMYGVQKARKVINFVGRRGILFGVSGVLILAGIVGIILNGSGAIGDRNSYFNLSVEFQGGVSTSVEFKDNYTIKEFNEKILPKIQEIAGDGDVLANAVNGTNEYVIRTKELPVEVQEDIKQMLIDKFGAIEGKFDETNVSATVSQEMAKDSVVATSIAVVCMLIYIFVRFRDIRFAAGAIACLCHDILLVIVFYAVSWTTVGNTFIACILTILGYSINATIVVFDRIREKLKATGYTGDLKEIVNSSVTDTLTRSIYTSLTTFITVAALYVLGVTAMKEFALPLIVGIFAGAYSSVCLAASLWYTMSKKRFESGLMRKKFLESQED